MIIYLHNSVLYTQNFYIQEKKTSTYLLHVLLSILTDPTSSFPTGNNLHSPRIRKKRPLPLHVSLYRIEAERANVILRTKNKLARLALDAAARQDVIVAQPQATTTTTNRHCCLNTFCFCLLLVVLNLLIMQWLYYKTLNKNLTQL